MIFLSGRSYRDAPEVDGEILINKKNNKIKIGKFYDVEINDYDEYDLFGDILLDERKREMKKIFLILICLSFAVKLLCTG